MIFSDDEKKTLLKAFTLLLKDANGKGPKNIYLKAFNDEIHIVMQGVVSHFEKYLIRQFGDEAISCLEYFYQKDAFNVEKRFLEILNVGYTFKFYALESDFKTDLFIYKMKMIASCNSDTNVI
jgi:hypothetical protein